MKRLSIALFIAALAASPVHATTESEARGLFTRYQSLERTFNPAIADLYCDSALIRNVRHYPTGEQRTMEFPAPQYKALIRTMMPTAKARDDFSTYSDVRVTIEGDNVRIVATRYSNLRKYVSPISILVGACPGGRLGILQELSQSRP